MRAHVIRGLLKVVQLQPFVLNLVDGNHHEVKHPEQISVTKDTIYLYSIDYSTMELIEPLHVISIEVKGKLATDLPPNFKPNKDDDFGPSFEE